MHKLLWDQLINMSEQKLTWHTIKSKDPEAFQLEPCLGNSKIEWNYYLLCKTSVKWGSRQTGTHACLEKHRTKMRQHMQELIWPIPFNLCLHKVQLPSNHVHAAKRVCWNMHMFTVTPKQSHRRWLNTSLVADGRDRHKKSGDVPVSLQRHLLELSFSCGNGSFPHLWGLSTSSWYHCP